MIDLQSIACDVKPHVLEAGNMIAQAWESHHFTSHLKDSRDVVTNIDEEVEQYLRSKLYTILPQAGFIVEEGKTEMNGEWNWAIDPIDGTKYFASGAPLFYTQIALLQKEEPVLNFVYQPIAKQLFSAIKGKGAYLNEKLLTPHLETDIKNSIVEFDTQSLQGEENAWKFELIEKIGSQIYRPRFSSSYLGLYLTTGTVDALIDTNIEAPPTIKNIVDISSHKLIITEAGYSESFINFMGHNIHIWAPPNLLQDFKRLLS